jgi:mRNA interferase YafQ
MRIVYSPEFVRRFKKLPQKVKDMACEKEVLFRQHPFTPSLKTHKLSGRMSGKLAFSISYPVRIVFSFVENDQGEVHFHSIGRHDEVYK